MRRIFLFALMTLIAATSCAQDEIRTVAVLGDSYSTFDGYIPEGNAAWYFTHPQGENDVVRVEDTWWHRFCAAGGYELVLNESWSGSTICNTGYDSVPCPTWSFIARMKNVAGGADDPDLILVFGTCHRAVYKHDPRIRRGTRVARHAVRHPRRAHVRALSCAGHGHHLGIVACAGHRDGT